MLSGIITLFIFAAFGGVVWWAWDRRNSDRFAEAARLPLEEDSVVLRRESGEQS
jgi:cytochrome c oxidase cbb3-type subunit 4